MAMLPSVTCRPSRAAAVNSVRLPGYAAQRRSSCCHAFQPTRPTLFDVPLSPYGARVRYCIYKYGLEDQVDIRSPAELGGVKSEEYMALHPAGKMPLLVLPSGQGIPESAVIQDYVLDAMVPGEPDLVPKTPEARAKAQFITQYLDLYFGRAMQWDPNNSKARPNTAVRHLVRPIGQPWTQVAMYKPMPLEERVAGLADIDRILHDLEALCDGPWLCGANPTTADAAAMPLFVFITFMLPRFFGWDVFAGRPKLAAWWAAIRQDPHAKRVMDEMTPALQAWEDKGRWDTVGVNDHVKTPGFKWTYP